MAAGVEVQLDQSELMAALHLADEGGNRVAPLARIRLPEVDEVAVVRQNEFRPVAERAAVLPERRHRLFRVRRRRPLPLVLGEHGEGGRAQFMRVDRRVFNAAGDADVCSDIFHGFSPLLNSRPD